MQVGPPSICRRNVHFCGRDIPRFEDPFRFRKKHPWMTKAERNSKVLHVERMLLPQGPPPYVLQLRNWDKQPHSLALKHNKSLGKKSSTTSKVS